MDNGSRRHPSLGISDRAAAIPTVWVDTDCALGAARGDVDDGFALAAVVAAHLRSTCHLTGMSSVFGNTEEETAFRCIQDLLEVAARAADRASGAPLWRMPVWRMKDAAEEIAALPDGAEIFALGPMTTVAEALKIDDTLLERTSIRVVATVIDRWRHPILPRFCLNSRRDPEAAAAVFAAARAAGIPAPDEAGARTGLRVLPLDVVKQLRVGKSEIRELSTGGPLARYLADHSQRWLRQSMLRYQSPSFPVWDLVAALDGLGLVASPESRRHAHKTELVGFDARETWRGFLELIAAP